MRRILIVFICFLIYQNIEAQRTCTTHQNHTGQFDVTLIQSLNEIVISGLDCNICEYGIEGITYCEEWDQEEWDNCIAECEDDEYLECYEDAQNEVGS